jgi:hypothetical protein
VLGRCFLELNTGRFGVEFSQVQESELIMVRLFGEETQNFTSVLTPEQIVQSWVAKAQGSGFERPIASIELEISI